MFALHLAAWLERRGFHYGFVIVAVTFIIMLTAAGAMGVPGALILPLEGEFHWSVVDISSALAIRLFLFGLMAPFAAALIERYGVRKIVLIALSLLICGIVLSLFMTKVWQLILLWGLTLGIGSGLTALVLGAIVSGRWFTRYRGVVLGVLTASSATGQLAFLPLAAFLAERAGWRFALFPSLFGLALAGLLALLFLRDHPSDLGIAPFGGINAAAQKPAAQGNAFSQAFAILGESTQSAAFWILFGTFFICGLSTNGLIQTHLIPFCADYGMPPVEAATLLAMMGAFDFAGTILSGYLSDRFDNRLLLFTYYGLRGLSLLALPSSTFTLYGLSIFAMFYGLDWIATVPPTVKLCQANFGRKSSIVFGWVFAAHQMGAATAAFGAGFTRSEFSTYLPAFYTAAFACLAAALASLMIGRIPLEGLFVAKTTITQDRPKPL